jgi:hypothetical protein
MQALLGGWGGGPNQRVPNSTLLLSQMLWQMLSPSIYSITILLNNPKMSLLQAGQKNQQKELTTGFFFTFFAFGLIFHFLKKDR